MNNIIQYVLDILMAFLDLLLIPYPYSFALIQKYTDIDTDIFILPPNVFFTALYIGIFLSSLGRIIVLMTYSTRKEQLFILLTMTSLILPSIITGEDFERYISNLKLELEHMLVISFILSFVLFIILKFDITIKYYNIKTISPHVAFSVGISQLLNYMNTGASEIIMLAIIIAIPFGFTLTLAVNFAIITATISVLQHSYAEILLFIEEFIRIISNAIQTTINASDITNITASGMQTLAFINDANILTVIPTFFTVVILSTIFSRLIYTLLQKKSFLNTILISKMVICIVIYFNI